MRSPLSLDPIIEDSADKAIMSHFKRKNPIDFDSNTKSALQNESLKKSVNQLLTPQHQSLNERPSENR
jgi:hypothetical protein